MLVPAVAGAAIVLFDDGERVGAFRHRHVRKAHIVHHKDLPVRWRLAAGQVTMQPIADTHLTEEELS